MQKIYKHKIAVFFTIFFMAIIAAPTIISSIDDSVDISGFYGLTEEEESESFKLVFENLSEDIENCLVVQTKENQIVYTYKTYPKPHLNLISPPPENINV
ncbi:hypothetical protein [Winogradskyella immobilis]|nr:hypothetical protein [Winogradskyella immobilis]MCG0015362.1 hypothetical protein [Winogradskyella immobilis]